MQLSLEDLDLFFRLHRGLGLVFEDRESWSLGEALTALERGIAQSEH